MLQIIVNDLEHCKRRLGRQYAKSQSEEIRLKYNDLETDIRYLCTKFGLTRSTKPYFLPEID